MHIIKKPRQVFFENNFKGKYTGYLFVSSFKNKTTDVTKKQLNFTKIYYDKNYFENDSLKCINTIKQLLDQEEFEQYIKSKYNVECEIIKIYSVSKKINIYIVVIDVKTNLLGFKNRTFIDLYNYDNSDIYEQLTTNNILPLNGHIYSKQIYNNKDSDLNVNINLFKVYKSLIGVV